MNYLNIIQKTLGIELIEKKLIKVELDPRKVRDLAYALKEYYNEYKMFEKPTNVFRPYIPLRFKDGSDASLKYNAIAAGGKFDHSNFFETAAKRYLLYAHEICLHDPLSYMLDFFELGPYNKYALDRLPAIKQVLIELARLKPLIDRNIIHIISDQLFPGISDYNLVSSMREIQDIVKQKIPDEYWSITFEMLIKSIYEQFLLQKDIDLYFPTDHFATHYRTLLEVCGEKFTSGEIKPSFHAGMIGGLQLLDSSKLSAKDIIGIREDENVFAQWRLLVSSTLDEMIRNKAYYNDHESEFKKVIAEQNQKLQLDLFKNAGKSAFIDAIPKAKDKVFFGLGSYFILNAVAPSFMTPGPSSPANAIMVAILELLSGLGIDEKSKARIRTAKQNHFLLLKQ